MTTRTKAIASGFLVVSAGILWFRSAAPSEIPQVTVTFKGYRGGDTPVLQITNHTDREFLFSGIDENHRKVWFHPGGSYLGSHEGFELIPQFGSSRRIFVQCRPWRPSFRRRIESILKDVRINIASTGFVAAVDLPAK